MKKCNGKVGVISLGCPKNLINTEQMMYLLSQEGFDVSGAVEGADFVVINTCGFISEAEQEAHDVITEALELKNKGSAGFVVVCGCLPERRKKELFKKYPEIDAIVGTGSFDEIVTVLDRIADESKQRQKYKQEKGHEKERGEKQGLESKKDNEIKKDQGNKQDKGQKQDQIRHQKHKKNQNLAYFGDINAPVSETKRINTTSPVWTYLKIAEGCDNKCAYCTIPAIRGKYRSRPLESILTEARVFASGKSTELILVAQDLMRYGMDIYGKRRIISLLEGLVEIDEVNWIRLMYTYPGSLDDEVIDFIAKSDKIVKYIDLPIQHISDKVLTSMKRSDNAEIIRRSVEKLRDKVPGVVLRTSVITGHPGEGEREFDELCEFLEEARFERGGVFPFSPEAGTASYNMPRVNSEIAHQRAEEISKIFKYNAENYAKARVGTTTTVIAEPDFGGGAVNISETTGDSDGLTCNFDNIFGSEVNYYMARSYAEAPEIDDPILLFSSEKKKVVPYSFNEVVFTDFTNGYLSAEVL